MGNERRPQFQGKWKKTSISRKIEDDLNLKKIEDYINFSFWFYGRRFQFFWQNERQLLFFSKMEDDFNLSDKWKTTSILRE